MEAVSAFKNSDMWGFFFLPARYWSLEIARCLRWGWISFDLVFCGSYSYRDPNFYITWK